MNDEKVAELLRKQWGPFIRKLPTGEWATVHRFLFTTGLLVGLQPLYYRTRFCYEHPWDALDALNSWDGRGDPPGPWIKEKGQRMERNNPATFKGVKIEVEQ